ncbi:hypothetical protein JW926_12740 [Candidatus Sumerlaeota bacterium]|nr:hypothetical protein [Candidatus Sumerlaeota bacterium]
MKKLISRIGASLLLALLCAPAMVCGEDPSDEKNPHLWEPRTTSVAVFKNELGFFMREGDVNLRDGWCVAKQIPPAAFGTLAIYSHKEGEIVDIVGSGPGEIVEFDDKDAPSNPEVKMERLESCLNLNVSLNYKAKSQERSSAGKLVSINKDFVILENDANSFAVPLDGISRMQILELPIRVHVASGENKSPEKTLLGMAYLRKGITWIPEYTLKILDESTAELVLRGTLVNEAEDLVHCDVNFVVGVPHFIHTDYNAPISVGQMIRTIGSVIAPQQIQSQLLNNAFLSNDMNLAPTTVIERSISNGGGDLKGALGNLPQIEGAAGTDYTVYAKKDLTIRRGEKAVVTLFTKRISYSHIYRWNIPDKMRHFIALHNETDTAWTTGACLAMSAGQPLCEDILKYAPKGGRTELPVTTAINIAHSKSETEIDRKLNAHSPAKDIFLDMVTLRGELKMRNYEKTKVDISIHAPLPGKPIDATDGGNISINTENLKLLERSGGVQWTISLDPAESKTLNYHYERYVPSH